MRVAVLADIHGNLPAFEAALQHARQQGADQLVIAGDIAIGAPDGKACWDLAASLGCPILMGNHERYLGQYGTPQAPADWADRRFAPLHWASAQLTEAERRVMGALPLALRLPDAPDLLIVHASERSDHDTVSQHTPAHKLEEMFPTAIERTIVRAHNHYPQARLWRGGVIITIGAVGLPLDGNPTAQYLQLDQTKDGWEARHHSVPYDLNVIIRRYHESGFLEATGPIGYLYFREVVMATQHLVPFLRMYAQWQQQGEISLEAALERFLAYR
jgi:hypothetical protein